LEQLLADTECLAVNLQQSLVPLEGWDLPVFPPVGSNEAARCASDELSDGTRVICLNGIADQAQRMKSVFHTALAGYIPNIDVAEGDQRWSLTTFHQGLADERVRASDLSDEARAALEAYQAGDPLPLSSIDPLAVLHGAHDDADTGVRVPRLVRSEIHAWDVEALSATGAFGAASERHGDVDGEAGGLLVRGRIVHNATLDLAALRALESARSGLATYAMGLALGGLWRGACDYDLSPGCRLVPDGSPTVAAVYRDGRRTATSLSGAEVGKALLSASAAARQLGLPVGEQRLAACATSTG